jgi:type IV fimbrial biogenesis protein FimT
MNRALFDGADARLRVPLVQAAARRHGRGFTLIELLVTLAVAVVLIMIAVPSFTNITVSNKLTTTANDLVGAINTARMEAIKRNASTQFCSNLSTANVASATDALGTKCGTDTGAVSALLTGTTAAQVFAGTTGITAPIQLTGNVAAVRFDGQGLGHAVGSTALFDGLVADISTSAISTNNHRCINMTAGSIVVTTSSTVACP